MAAKNKFLNAMKMPSIDDMFSSEADRQRESGDLVTEVPLSELHPFVGHPFEVRDDEDMQKLVDSIRENGVLTNLTVRRRAEGGYEIISGHRRFHAAQRAGLDRVKVQVRDIDDDQAIIDMVDSNIQREHISPMEKARAYAMRLDAAQRKRGRPSKENYSQVGNNFGTRTSSDELAEKVGESKNQIFRYVRLNNLVPDLQKKVDDGSLKFNPAVELSYLSPTEQNDFLDYIESQSCSPSLSQAQKLKAASNELAFELWNTHYHEARLLAVLIFDHKCLSYDQIDTLMSEVLSWDLCDHLCKNLIIKLDYYEDFIFNWIAADHIYKKRASFVLIAASTIHDKSMTKETLDIYLKLVYENSCYEHDHIKKAVSWALREIGKTDFEYAEKVLLTAYDLLASGNKVQIWIAKDVIKELETVVKVKERKRLITSNSKMGRER